ncbi:MAG: cytochrome c biogenesis protein CcdA [Thermoleophilaceae bacterium]
MDPAGGVGVLAAVAAGLVSFLSPCVLPLVPAYLSAVVGVAPADLQNAGRRRVLVPGLLFVLSFSTIFILLGMGATTVGSGLQAHRQALEKAAAVLIVFMGLFFMSTPFIDRLNKTWHVDGLLNRAGRGGPLVAGAAFAIAWTPCIGPTLGAILTAAALSGSAAHGALLLAFYSAGLAIPFLATALALNRMTGAFRRVREHFALIMAAGGAVLIAMGVLIWTGELFVLNLKAQELLNGIGLNIANEF